MVWSDTDCFLERAERDKEKRYYAWLDSISSHTTVFYAAVSIHGRRGEGCDKLINFCAKLRASRHSTAEAYSQQAIFRYAWSARLSLAANRATYLHASQVVAKLLGGGSVAKKPFKIFKARQPRDIIYHAGATALRVPLSSQEVGGFQ